MNQRSRPHLRTASTVPAILHNMAHILGNSLYKSLLKVVLIPLYQMSSFAHAAEIIESIDIVNSKGCRCVPARWCYFSGKMSLKVCAGAAVWAVYASCCYCRPFSRILQFQSVKFQNIIQSNLKSLIRQIL